ncbi:hypothetical protein O2N63_14970 [Aliiroseovarius sp. KMU-50]|uniref:Calcium-binding protein n=1 Tax=Aliiroseovarius salicola TaxID=3009082 RepID=A0ABT4W6D4_9RHOB|nr:hypothetical protein [Aliiroseovarius sp. KMU-50]MDA5095388.1 hypothetical protein [Aliiroseovarius sp. KMU-50]
MTMSALAPTLVKTVSYTGDANRSNYSELLLIGEVLYATTDYDGQVEAWDLAGGKLARFDTQQHTRSDYAGVSPSLAVLDTGAQPFLLTGGGSTGNLMRINLTEEGNLASYSSLGTVAEWGGDLGQVVSYNLSNGKVALYGALQGSPGIGQLLFDSTGTLSETRLTGDNDATVASGANALAAATIGGKGFVYSVSASNVGITSWAIGGDGALTSVQTIGADDNLWVSAPTKIEVATVDGVSFLVLASAGSNSLTVMHLSASGSVTVVDHVLDNRNTRFSDVSAMAVVQSGDASYVIAGGSDDGVTVFQLLSNGKLVEQGTLADSNGASMQNVSAISAQPTTNGFNIFVTSSSEIGITKLKYNLGAPVKLIAGNDSNNALTGSSSPDQIEGGAGNDTLVGQAGHDVLYDGFGVDVLTGGLSGDTFVFAADGERDVITDFDPSEDRIDLSQWHGLRASSQLTVKNISDDYHVSFGDEVLEIRSNDWKGMTFDDLAETALIGLDRVPMTFQPIPSNETGDPTPYTLNGTPGRDYLISPGRISVISGWGGDDKIIGSTLNDKLYGGDGRDVIYGGGQGGDLIVGGAGNDLLVVGTVDDFAF